METKPNSADRKSVGDKLKHALSHVLDPAQNNNDHADGDSEFNPLTMDVNSNAERSSSHTLKRSTVAQQPSKDNLSMQPKSNQEPLSSVVEFNPVASGNETLSTGGKRKHGDRTESARKAQRTGHEAQDDKMAPSGVKSPNAKPSLIQFSNKGPLNQGPNAKGSFLEGNAPNIPSFKLKLVSSKSPDNLQDATPKLESRTQKINKDVRKTGRKIHLWWTELGETEKKKEEVKILTTRIKFCAKNREENAGDAIEDAPKADIMDLSSEIESGYDTGYSEKEVPFDSNPPSPTQRVRPAGAVVDQNGSPMLSRKSHRMIGSGVDANDLMMNLRPQQLETEGGLKMPSGPLSRNSISELDQQELGGPSSWKRSETLMPFSSSTRKAVPSSPTAPSRMLQDLVGHEEITGGEFVSMQNAEIVKPGTLEDPFADAPAPNFEEYRLLESLHAIAHQKAVDIVHRSAHHIELTVDEYEGQASELYVTLSDAYAALHGKIRKEAKAACDAQARHLREALLQLGQIWATDTNTVVGNEVLTGYRDRLWEARERICSARRDLGP